MAGMEALGRLCNVFPVASGNPFRLRDSSGALIVCWDTTGSQTATATLTQDSSFGGGFSNGAYVVKNIYTNTKYDGTGAWTKQTYNPGTAPWTGAAANNVNGPTGIITFNNAGQNFATALMIAFHVFTSELSDPNSYIKCTMTGAAALCSVFTYDLVHQRAPANLAILGA